MEPDKTRKNIYSQKSNEKRRHVLTLMSKMQNAGGGLCFVVEQMIYWCLFSSLFSLVCYFLLPCLLCCRWSHGKCTPSALTEDIVCASTCSHVGRQKTDSIDFLWSPLLYKSVMAADSQECECHCTELYINSQMSVPQKNIMTAIQCQSGITNVGNVNTVYRVSQAVQWGNNNNTMSLQNQFNRAKSVKQCKFKPGMSVNSR